MKRTSLVVAVVVMGMQALAMAQTKDVNQVLADARKALGGDKLSSVKTLGGLGRTLRTNAAGNTMESEFELSMELPDKYLMHTVLANMGTMSVYRNSGFNGGQIIEEIDQPPNLAGGNVIIRMAGPGGNSVDPAKMTPEQKAEFDKRRLAANQREYAKLALGMFAGAPSVYPMQFTYAGQAESADGKADVIDVKSDDGFAAKLFIDETTHLPLMLSWMDKEPVRIQTMTGGPGGGQGTRVVQSIGGGGGGAVAAGGTTTFSQSATAGGAPPSKEEVDKMQKDMEAKLKEAQANAKLVEYRVYYTEYQNVGGVKLPFRIQKSVDGKTSEEMVFDTLKLNPKLDAKKFQPSK